jgi:uncharacterized protein
MSVITELFGKSPFGPLLEHTKRVHECTKLIKPLLEACVRQDAEEIHRLQDEVSRLEYAADLVKQEVREQLPRRYFLPVERSDLDRFLHSQDNIADGVQDFAVILFIRRTSIHPDLVAEFRAFVDQVIETVAVLMQAAEEMGNLVEASFGGAEAEIVLKRVSGLNEAEWKADRMQRAVSQHIYQIEKELDPITILFYEKMLGALSGIANAAENTGERLRQMIVKR